MKKSKLIFSFILSLILLFNIVLVMGGIFVRYRIYSNKYYLSQYEKVNYYDSLSNKIEMDITTIARVNNIPKEAFQPYYDKAWIRKQVDAYAGGILDYLTYKNNKLYAISFDSQRKQFEESIDKYLKDQKVAKDSRVTGEINNARISAEKIVTNSINIFDLSGSLQDESFQSLRASGNAIYKAVLPYILAVILVLACMVLVFRKKIKEILLWYGYSITSAGILTFALSMIINLFMDTSNLPLKERYIVDYVSALISGYITFFMWCGAITAILGALLSILTNKFMKNADCKYLSDVV